MLGEMDGGIGGGGEEREREKDIQRNGEGGEWEEKHKGGLKNTEKTK